MIKRLSKTHRNDIWSGLSTDTKPVPPVFPVSITSKFYETDSGLTFEYRGGAVEWVESLFFDNEQLRPAIGWTDGAECAGGSTFPVKFNTPVTFTDATGVTFVNVTTAETATAVASATASPSNQIIYTMTWVVDPIVGDDVEWHIDGTSNYVDPVGTAIVAQTLQLTNCLGTFTASIYQGTKTTDTTLRTESLATGATKILVDSNAGTGLVTVFNNSTQIGTVSDGLAAAFDVTAGNISWSSASAGTIEL